MPRPNILLVLADDMGYGDFGMFNGEASHTPALDQLARESICLTQHYSASPICSPARAGLLTGRYPHRTGAVTPQEVLGLDRISLDEMTVADALKHAGYATGLVGKWHNGALDRRFHPNCRGFDEFVGFTGGWTDYYRWQLDYGGVHRQADGRYLTDVLTEEAIGFIHRHRTEPFFLSVMYSAPHAPLQAPDELVQRYQQAGFNRGVSFIYAMIEVMDAGVARLLDTLDAEGLADNTIVIFSSDNGPAYQLGPQMWLPDGVDGDLTRFNCGLNGAKRSVYEGGIRVPLLLRWPAALEGGREVDDLVHFTDWMPTLLSMAQVDRPEGLPLDGLDMWPVIQGEARVAEPRRFWQWNSYQPNPVTNAAARDGDWKLVRPAIGDIRPATPQDERMITRHRELDLTRVYHPEQLSEIVIGEEPKMLIPDPPQSELYNIREDPMERNNLAARETLRVSRMTSELDSWFEQVEVDYQRTQQ